MRDEIVLENDPRLNVEELQRFADGTRQLRLAIDTQENRFIVARAGTNGPIVASAAAQGFRLFAGSETYLRVIEQYDDGSRLAETAVLLSPFLPQLMVRIDIVVGGITFDDGTVVKELTPPDFNALGEARVRFIQPASAKTSVCNMVRVYQGDSLIGTR